MRRYDRPLPAWQQRNKRGPGRDRAADRHPDYREGRIEELRMRGEQLMHNKRCLIEDIEVAREAGLPLSKLEAELSEQQRQYEQIEASIKKLYDR